MDNKLEIRFDILSLAALILTFTSVLFSLRLSLETIVLSVSVFLIIFSTYIFMGFKNTINEHAREFQKVNEKINIYKNLSDLKAKIDILFIKMGKRGNGDITEIIIRVIQVAAIVFAGYIILKALGTIPM